ncbi:MAG: NTP transferase domain-containing protein [Puniceicoccales bacterium]|jgi:UTP-glucose-1-phosphate uridylyltransferase|nr:NTP transferase domain-containing protein [Puniceicoccales bacterium]
MDKVAIVILAAGIGSRYGGPKQMKKIGPGAHAIFEYSLRAAYDRGFRRVVCVIQRSQREEMEELLEKPRQFMEIHCVEQDPSNVPSGTKIPIGRKKPWGTAHATYAAAHAVNGPFLVINGDDLYGHQAWKDMEQLIGRFPKENATIAYRLRHTVPNAGAVSRGLCISDGEYLEKIEEFFQIEQAHGKFIDGRSNRCFTGDEPVSMNFFYFQREIFQIFRKNAAEFFNQSAEILSLAEWMLPTVANECSRSGEISMRISITNASWMGITNASDAALVDGHIDELVRRGAYPKYLWENILPTP